MNPQEESKATINWAAYQKKIWIKWSILAFIVIFILLFKAIVNIFLLLLVSALLAIYFYGFAGLVQRYLRLSATGSLIVSVIFNLMLLAGFFWFAGTRLESQIAQLSYTLPSTIEKAKAQINQSTTGRKALDYLNSSGSAEKSSVLIKRFFS